MPIWKYIGSCVDGEKLEISGLNVWDYQWIRRNSERAHVKDPHYGQNFSFEVYEIAANSHRVVFAAGEFSASIWGFYIPAR